VFGRRHVKTQNELMREELGEGFDHLRMAASHAAGTAAALLAPRLEQVRDRLEPTLDKSKSAARSSAQRSAELARESARRANKAARKATGKKKKESGMAKRWPMVVGGLVLAGAAATAASAVMSRRRQKKWNDYGSTSTTTGLKNEGRSYADTARSTASSVTDTAKEKATDVLGQMKSTTEKATSSPSPHPTGTRNGEFTAGETYKSGTATGTPSRNSRP